jgi:chromosome segregation ATPase
MPDASRTALAAGLAAALALALPGSAPAQTKGSGKIVCWKDKSGKIVGCGDQVPPEYQESGTRELDRRGITRATTESAEEAAKRKAREQELAKQKAEEQKRLAEQRRQDAALLNAFTHEKEIDLKRDRDLQVVETRLAQLRTSLKNATDRHAEARARLEAAEKSKKPPAEALKEEVARAEAEKKKAEQDIAAAEQEKEEIRRRYAEMKLRYVELRAGSQAAAAPAPAKK